MNMDISKSIFDTDDNIFLVKTAQKIALYSVFPFMFILATEALIKNLVLINSLNICILGLNLIIRKISKVDPTPLITPEDPLTTLPPSPINGNMNPVTHAQMPKAATRREQILKIVSIPLLTLAFHYSLRYIGYSGLPGIAIPK